MKCLAAITCLLALTASSKADGLYGTEVYAPGHASVDYYAYPRYAFEYAVRDPHTGDNKAQWEKRDGDVVRGAYSLVEPDGSLRVVEYRADDKTGFNAVVKRIGPNLHPVSTPIYKAPLPVIGYKSEAPISIGPVAGLERLASAPLLNGPYLGGHASSYSSLYKSPEPSIIKEVIKEPIIPIPIIKEPIVPYPIIKEPYLPIYKESIYNPASILKEPILQGYKSPIYAEPYLGPIVKQPWLSAPLYPSYPAIKGPLLTEPRLYGGYPSIKSPILSEPRLYGGYSAIKDPRLYEGYSAIKEPLITERLYGGYPAIKGPLLPVGPLYGGYDLGLIGKGLLGDKGLGLYDVKDYKGYAGIGQGH